MGLKSLFSPKPPAKPRPDGSDYIDLEEYTAGMPVVEGASMMVRIGEIARYDDLREFANWVYQGNLLILDYEAIARDEVVHRRVISELKKLVADVNGDIAGYGKNMLIVAPTGVKIDRRKARIPSR